MDSSPNPKPLSALVVVEGDTEIEFFKLFGDRVGLNLTLHTVKCNVYTLFKWMIGDCGDVDLTRESLVLDVPKLIAGHESDEKKRALLLGHYDALYLIYDCDIQDSRVSDKYNPKPIVSRARANFAELEQMVRLLDDEYSTTVGKLYVNYPMFEACLDADSFADPAFQMRKVSLDELPDDGYKRRVKGRFLHYAWQRRLKWEREDFYGLIRMNVHKAANLMGVDVTKEISSKIQLILSQADILDKQRESATQSETMSVLNTSVFMPIEQFGQTFLTRVMECRMSPTVCFDRDGLGSRGQDDFTVFRTDTGTHDEMLLNALRGVLRIFREVDLVIFPHSFCVTQPEYRNLLKIYDMSDERARTAALSRLEKDAGVNWCCRTDLVASEGSGNAYEIASGIKGSIVYISDSHAG